MLRYSCKELPLMLAPWKSTMLVLHSMAISRRNAPLRQPIVIA